MTEQYNKPPKKYYEYYYTILFNCNIGMFKCKI